MGTIGKFAELEAWTTGRELANLIYDLTDVGAFAKDFSLRDQLRRSAISAISNIAEGFDSRTHRGFVHFLGIATASLSKAKSQLYLALDRNYIDGKTFDAVYDLCDKTARQISKFIDYLEQNRPND
ncbi:MAG: four helix bundle protein [Acidobacteriota bacterium]|nr:MAG: four helix bundle protein [Acidobacteriota bacterium]